MEKAAEKKAGLLLVISYFAMFLILDTEFAENILLKVADAMFWSKYIDLFVYLSLALALTMVYKNALIESLRDFIKNRDRYLKQCSSIGIATVAIVVVTAIILARFSIGESSNQQLIDGRLERNRVIMTLVVCLIGPFVEEMIYRGILYEKVIKNRKSRKRIVGSILATSLLFALNHFGILNIFKMEYYIQLLKYIPIFVIGVGLNCAYEKTRNIYAPIVVHICINIISSYG